MSTGAESWLSALSIEPRLNPPECFFSVDFFFSGLGVPLREGMGDEAGEPPARVGPVRAVGVEELVGSGESDLGMTPRDALCTIPGREPPSVGVAGSEVRT